MKQVLQSLKTGEIEVVECPAPAVRARHVLIEARRSLISVGTERMLLDFGRASPIGKALQQPDKVRQTIQKARTDGVAATVAAVRSKLDEPISLGYCSAGVVREVGAEVTHLKPGDRVVSNAPHAELALVGRNLTARIPDEVSDEAAAFTPLGAIALQGCRLAAPALGETFCVMGLGLIGLLAVQLLRAHGCKVIGADFSADRLALARRWGAETVDLSAGQDPVAAAMAATGGEGVDGVLVTAATDSDAPMAQSAQMCRKRGRIVLVGVAGLKLSRADFYEKELSFQVSCSYGPGRYDPAYEVRGEDYPRGFVRWTEQRNFEAVLAEMAAGRLEVEPLISDTVPIDRAGEVYARLTDKGDASLGLLLAYPEGREEKFAASVRLGADAPAHAGAASVALIGAGNFGGKVTAPGLKAAGARLHTIVSQRGVTSVVSGRASGFENAATDVEAALANPEIDSVVIATRHGSHADLTAQALRAGKHVFVEKPLALTESEIDSVLEAHAEAGVQGAAPQLMVGFNRRFSPFSVKMKSLLDRIAEPKCLIATINAGAIPAGHWVHDPEDGGGRILGEACHFIDLMRYFTGAPITEGKITRIGRPAADGVSEDKATITLSFEDGSIATVHYFANGPKALMKERFEAYAGGRYLALENFKALRAVGWPRGGGMNGKQDKGHFAALAAFIEAVKSGGPAPIPLEELVEVSRWSVSLARSGGGAVS